MCYILLYEFIIYLLQESRRRFDKAIHAYDQVLKIFPEKNFVFY